MTPVSSRGAAPKTCEARSDDGGSPGCGSAGAVVSGPPAGAAYQSTNPRMPACTISPTQERSSALRSSNHGRSLDIRPVAAVLRAPVELRRASAARRLDGGMARL